MEYCNIQKSQNSKLKVKITKIIFQIVIKYWKKNIHKLKFQNNKIYFNKRKIYYKFNNYKSNKVKHQTNNKLKKKLKNILKKPQKVVFKS